MAIACSNVGSWGYVLVLSKFLILCIDAGIAKSFGVLIPTMVERLESDYATVGLICSLPSTLMYLLCPCVALVLPKTNHRVVAILGGVLCGSCIIASAFFNNSVTVGVCLALSGYLFDATQSFTKVFIIMGFLHGIMVVHLFIVSILIKRRRQDVSSDFDN